VMTSRLCGSSSSGTGLAIEKKGSQQEENLYTISNELAISIPPQVRLGARIVLTREYYIQKDIMRCRGTPLFSSKLSSY
jgi:hypothetical protein